MIMIILLGLTSVALAAVAGFFSIIGLAEFAAAAATPIMIFGISLESSKLIATAFLHYHWSDSPRWLRVIGVFFVGVVMVITSVGIYGFISAAHFNQNTPLQAVEMQVALLDQQIDLQKQTITRFQTRLTQMDGMVNGFMSNEKLTNATAIRDKQKKERIEVEDGLKEAYAKINELETKKLELKQSVSAVEAKLGPAKSAAKLLGIDEANAVNLFILLLMIPFDPFAVWLVMATTWKVEHWQHKQVEKKARQKIEDAERQLIEKENAELERQRAYEEAEAERQRAHEEALLARQRAHEEAEWEAELAVKKLEHQRALERIAAETTVVEAHTPMDTSVSAPLDDPNADLYRYPIYHITPEEQAATNAWINAIHEAAEKPVVSETGKPTVEKIVIEKPSETDEIVIEYPVEVTDEREEMVTVKIHEVAKEPETITVETVTSISEAEYETLLVTTEKEIDTFEESDVQIIHETDDPMVAATHEHIDDHDDMYIDDAVTTNIVNIIKRNPNVVDDLKVALDDEVPYPVLRELEKVLQALDTEQQKKATSGWLTGGKPSVKQPFFTGNL